MRRDVHRYRGVDPALRLVALHALRGSVVGAPGQEALAVGSGRRRSPDASLIAHFLKPPEIPPLITKSLFLGTLPRSGRLSRQTRTAPAAVAQYSAHG